MSVHLSPTQTHTHTHTHSLNSLTQLTYSTHSFAYLHTHTLSRSRPPPCPLSSSHWQAAQSLSQWLASQNIPGITGVDTRALTQKLRSKGSMLGKIIVGDTPPDSIPFDDPNKDNLVAAVSTKEPRVFNEGGDVTIVAVDVGLKNNQIRCLASRGARVKVSITSPSPRCSALLHPDSQTAFPTASKQPLTYTHTHTLSLSLMVALLLSFVRSWFLSTTTSVPTTAATVSFSPTDRVIRR